MAFAVKKTSVLKSEYIMLGILLLFALVVRLLLIVYHSHIPYPKFNIQQDPYADLVHALSNGKLDSFGEANERVFPGYPILIIFVSWFIKSEVVSGVLISLAASLASIYLFWFLTKHTIATWVFA